MAYNLISTVTVGAGGSANISFSSIPGTYTDLVIVVSSRIVATSDSPSFTFTFNGSSTTFTTRYLLGNGASASSSSLSSAWGGITDGSVQTANTFANTSIYIPNYAGSTNKAYSVDGISEQNVSTAFQSMAAGLWATTSAITSIVLSSAGGNFDQYSTASLYGIN